MKATLAASVAIFSFIATSGAAQTGTTSAAPAVAQRSITIDGKAFQYTTEVGVIPLVNEAGDVRGNMFSTSYIVKGSDANRPVIFIWNGGTTEPANWLHFRGFGPRLIDMDGKTFYDNPETPLPAADLVFVDAMGSSWSEPLRPEYGKEFYSSMKDALAVTQFIQTWLKRHSATSRPVFILGESTGVFRAGGVIERLESRGQRVAGAILVSGGAASGAYVSPTLRNALSTTQRAATALALGKLSRDVGTTRREVVSRAGQWALNRYLPALVSIASLSAAARDSIARELSLYTGYPVDKIDRKTLWVPYNVYLRDMSPDPNRALSMHDMRVTSQPDADDSAIEGYYRSLGYRPPRPYAAHVQGPLAANGQYERDIRWPQERTPWPGVYAENWLPHAMEINPHIKVLVVQGLYDSLNNCFEYDLFRGMLEPDLAHNYTIRCYLGGHMMYREPEPRAALSRDIENFVTTTLREQRVTHP